MITISAINTLLHTWLNTFSGITAIRSQGDGVKPNLPYMTYQILSMVSHGLEHTSVPNVNGLAKISGDRDMTVNVQCYGSNAYGRLEDLIHLRAVESSQILLSSQGIALIDIMSINDLTGLNEIDFEERATVDLLFRFVTQRTAVDVGLIEFVEIDGTVKAGSIDKDFTIIKDLT